MEKFKITTKCTNHQNYSYKIIQDKLTDQDFSLSLFNGTNIKESIFDTCDLKMIEFQGTQITASNFMKSSFESADIKSSLFKNTKFLEVNFNYSNIKDCTFEDCEFIKCTFDGANLLENGFVNCEFKEIFLDKVYGFLNDFKKTYFYNIKMSGSFYFSIFDMNELNDCEIDSYLLGYIYGLNTCKLNNILYQLSDNKTNSLNSAINYASQMYEKRYMYMNLGFLELLSFEENLEKNILICIGYLSKCLEKNIIIKSEETMFLKRIIDVEFENKNLSAFAIYNYFVLLSAVTDGYRDNYLKSVYQINNLKNQTYILFSKYLNSLSEFHIYKLNTKEFTLYIKYINKPEVSLESILNKIELDKNVINAKTIKSKEGCYLEWISCIAGVLPYLQILIDILGITIPILINKKNIKNGKKTFREESNTNELIINDEEDKLQITIKGVVDGEKKVMPLINVLKTEDITIKNNKMGYNKKNIIEIKITY